MEIDPNSPGLLDILAGKAGPYHRWFVTFALVLMLTLFILATRAIF